SKEAAEAFAGAIAVQKQLALDFPDQPEFRKQLANTRINMGRLHSSNGDLAGAESEFAAALVLQKQLAADFPTSPEFLLALAHSQNNLAAVFFNTSRLQQAETALRTALDFKTAARCRLPHPPRYPPESCSKPWKSGPRPGEYGTAERRRGILHGRAHSLQEARSRIPR